MTSFVFSLNRHVSVGFLMAETLLGWRHTTMFIFASVWRHAFIAVWFCSCICGYFKGSWWCKWNLM